MLPEFLFPTSFPALARRYGLIAGLRSLWLFLNSFALSDALLAFLPPVDPAFGGGMWFPPSPPMFLWIALGLYQWALLVTGAWRYWQRRQGREPVAAQVGTSAIDGARLQRPGWVTAALMAVSVIFACYAAVWLFLMATSKYGGTVPFNASFVTYGEWPFLIGLAISLFGLFRGNRFSASARAAVGGQMGVGYLAADHYLTQRVHALAARLDLPPPSVGTTRVLNAFAVGADRNQAAVVLGAPLLAILTSEEADAVIGHELGHIVSNDMQRMQLAAGFQQAFRGVITVATNLGGKTAGRHEAGTWIAIVGMVLNATVMSVSRLLMMAFSRSREFHADAVGAALTSPEAMIRALEKIHGQNTAPTPIENHYGYLMFRSGGIASLFATHPSLENRRKALQKGAYLKALPLKGQTLPAA